MPPDDQEREVIHDRTGAQRNVGYVIERDRANGVGHCWIEMGEEHLNYHGLLHGGMVATLLDVACGQTASMFFDPQDPAPVLTLSLNTSYVSSASSGRITATGKATGGGRSVCYVNGELRDENGAMLATAAGVFKRIRQVRKP